MRTNLKFTVASSPGHYQAAQRFLRELGMTGVSLKFPTIMAKEDGRLVGVCGTRVVDKMILAGPLMVSNDHRRLFTIMRLCEAYETAMGQIGVESFILGAEHGSILQRGMERYFPDHKPYAVEDGCDYYVWKVRGYGSQGQSTRAISGGEAAPS